MPSATPPPPPLLLYGVRCMSGALSWKTICCAALWMGARVLQIKLPSPSAVGSAPPWWELFDAKKEDMDVICERVAALYSKSQAAFVDLAAVPAPAPAPSAS